MTERALMISLNRVAIHLAAAVFALAISNGSAHAHGDVKPQAVDTAGLPTVEAIVGLFGGKIQQIRDAPEESPE